MYAECYKLDDIKRVFKIECYQKDPQTFRKTHYSLRVVFKDPQFRETAMMEDALLETQWAEGLDERRRSGDYIRPYVIWGATGTGKTELCRFFELNIPAFNSECESRRITKRELAMGGILGVAQALSGLEIDFADRLLARHGGRGVEDVAVYVMGNLIDRGKITIQAGDKDEVLKMCAPHIRHNVEKRVKLVETAEDISRVETALQFITPTDLDALSYYGVRMDIGKVNREIYHALTRFVADVDDVKRLTFDFIKNKNDSGKIPVLIFDDVTHLGDLVDDFVAVITDISGGEEGYVCDFIIGTTTEFYLSKFRDALASTVRARISEVKLSPEERENMPHANWLLGEDGLPHFLDFVLRYLDASRSCGGCSNCRRSPFMDGEYNYHPFTKTFLINFYNRIIREKDEPERRGITVSITPRFVIQVLRNVLSNFVETSRLPSSFMDNSLVLDTVDFFELKHEEKERMNEFLLALWWYGKHSKDGNRISLDIETIKQLGLIEQVPPHLKGKMHVEIDVRSLTTRALPSERRSGGVLVPRRPDDVSMLASIKSWCKGEDTQIALFTMAQGFDEVASRLKESLGGANNFRNIMNYKSSRAPAETIEFSAAGKRNHHFWIGKIRNDDLQLFVMSRYDEGSLKPFREKDFMILTLDEDDFFNLYKIGAKTTETERVKHLQNFLKLRRDDVFDVLSLQRLRLKTHLEKQLGHPTECFVLSACLLANKVLKSQTVLTEIKDANDLKQLIFSKPDLRFENWPSDIANLIENARMYNIDFSVAEALFHSFYSLRGEGSIIDYQLLEESWLRIKITPFQPLKEIGQIDDRFFLSKSKVGLKAFADFFRKLLDKIESISKTYEESVARKKIGDLRRFIAQISAKEQMIESLKKLKNTIRVELETESSELDEMIIQLRKLERPDSLMKKLSTIETKIGSIKDPVDKACILAILRNIENDPTVKAVERLFEVVEEIEEETRSISEMDLMNLKRQYLKYLKLKEAF